MMYFASTFTRIYSAIRDVSPKDWAISMPLLLDAQSPYYARHQEVAQLIQQQNQKKKANFLA